jgi:hypothetical protein
MGLGEKEAAETLADAAGLLEAHPGGMQLRMLQTMTEVAADSSSGRSREDRRRLLEPALGGTPTKTERSAYGIVTDLTECGDVVKENEEKDGRHNRYQIQAHLTLRETISRRRTIGEMLDLLVDTKNRTRG